MTRFFQILANGGAPYVNVQDRMRAGELLRKLFSSQNIVSSTLLRGQIENATLYVVMAPDERREDYARVFVLVEASNRVTETNFAAYIAVHLHQNPANITDNMELLNLSTKRISGSEWFSLRNLYVDSVDVSRDVALQ